MVRKSSPTLPPLPSLPHSHQRQPPGGGAPTSTVDPNEEPQTIVVTLPPGSVPGKEMLVPLPGGRHHFKMVVPPKGKPGMQMKLKIGGVKGATIGGSAATGVEAAGAELTATEGAEGAGVEGMDAAVNVSAQTSKGAADVKKIEHPTDPMGAREARGPGETKEDGEEKVEKVEKVEKGVRTAGGRGRSSNGGGKWRKVAEVAAAVAETHARPRKTRSRISPWALWARPKGIRQQGRPRGRWVETAVLLRPRRSK